jgi:hypothetical protein
MIQVGRADRRRSARRLNVLRTVVFSIAALGLHGCGGGGGEDDWNFTSWEGNNNGTVVMARDDFPVRFTSEAYLHHSGTTWTNVVVTGNATVLLNGSPFARVELAPASGGGQIAVLRCIASSRLVAIDKNGKMSCADPDPGTGGTNNTLNTGNTSNTGNTGSPGDPDGMNDTDNRPMPIFCLEDAGGGTNGLGFYSPTGITTYQLATTAAGAPSRNTLGWGVRYINPGLSAGSYSGSLRARLWAVSHSYHGGTISGYVLGTFIPNFTGPGAASPNQVRVGGSTTTQVQSVDSVFNPPIGSYCIVATLEEYDGGQFYIVDWIQFGRSAEFF